MRIHIGTSGWNYAHWKSVFYPENIRKKEWFSYYTKNFNTVEINYSFYNWPKEHVVQKWHDESPDKFTYTLKAPRVITHLKKLKDVHEQLKRFYSMAEILEKKMGCHLFQLPHNFLYSKNNLQKIKDFLKIIDKRKHNAIEFRDKNWFTKEIQDLLEKNKTAIVTPFGVDLPEKIMAGKIVYLRFHGVKRYSKQKLRSIVNTINNKKIKNLYAYFNNDTHGYAPINAKELKEML